MRKFHQKGLISPLCAMFRRQPTFKINLKLYSAKDLICVTSGILSINFESKG